MRFAEMLPYIDSIGPGLKDQEIAGTIAEGLGIHAATGLNGSETGYQIRIISGEIPIQKIKEAASASNIPVCIMVHPAEDPTQLLSIPGVKVINRFELQKGLQAIAEGLNNK